MFRNDELIAEKNILEKFDRKTVLVCGACGLIGSTLVELLLEANNALSLHINVIASARSFAKLQSRFEKYKGCEALKFLEADVSKADIFSELKYNIDFIVDCASPAHPVAYANTPVDVLTTNFLGTLNLLKLATDKSSRLLYVSSSEVYGQPFGAKSDDFANAENDYGYIDVLAKRSCYPEGKRSAENLCIAYGSQFGCDVVITRFCQIFGASVTADNTRADAQFLRNCLAGENIVLKSPAAQVRSMCYVKDAAFALLYILANGEAGNAYNVAGENSVSTIRELAECMAKNAGVKVILDFDEASIGHTFITRAVISGEKLKSIGWNPKYSIEQGVIDMLEVAKSTS